MGRVRNIRFLGPALAVLSLLIIALSLVKIEGAPFLSAYDSPVYDQLFRLRNVVAPPPISDELTLVGLDDYTMRQLGRWGEGVWKNRKPFRDQLMYDRRIYKPSVLAYDILFREDKGDVERSNVHEQYRFVLEDEAKLGRIVEALKRMHDGDITEPPSNVLLWLNRLSNELGLLGLATEMSRFDEASPEERTTILLAYNFTESEAGRQPWNQTQILGSDPNFLSEDEGTEVPFLRDVRIPLDYVTGLPKDYEWVDYQAEMPVSDLMDYSRMAYINVPRDSDGVSRYYPLVTGISYSFVDPTSKKTVERRYFVASLAMMAVMYHLGIDLREMNDTETYTRDGKPIVEVNLGHEIVLRPPNSAERHIPIDSQGRMYLNYVARTVQYDSVPFYYLTDAFMTKGHDSPGASGQDGAGLAGAEDAAATADGAAAEAEGGGDAPPEPAEPAVAVIPVADADAGEETVVIRYVPEIFEKLNRRIVFIGQTFTGGSDVGPTPVEKYAPMVVVHLTAANNILTNTYIHPMVWGERLVIPLLALVMLPISVYFAPLRYSLYQGTLFLCYMGAVYYGIHSNWVLLPITGPILFMLLFYLTVVLYNYLTEEREKRKIRGMFSTMVSPDVLNFMEENPDKYSLEGMQMEATMFFSDVAGFTTISETLSPTQLVDLLNQYLTPMTELVQASRGYVDKYEGDAIMAEWGVPYPNANHAKDGCWCALDQQAKLAELRPTLRERFGVDIHVRMGMNSGLVSAGMMGSETRMSYTVMGDAVNQAARFEPANKDYDTDIMIGETTYKLARDFIEVRHLDRIIVKGKTVPINIYELVAKAGELEMDKREVIRLYEEGMRLHWERKWDEALAYFEEALVINPTDGPSKAMHKRITAYKANPPPDTWQGEYIRATKD